MRKVLTFAAMSFMAGMIFGVPNSAKAGNIVCVDAILITHRIFLFVFSQKTKLIRNKGFQKT